MKFFKKHHWEGGKATLGFWPDRIGTGYHGNRKLIMEKTVLPLFLSCFSSNPFYTCSLQVMMTCMRAQRSSKFSQSGQPTAELAALERLKKSP